MIRPFLLLMLVANLAQARNLVWHEGSVVLVNQHVLVGEISIQSSEIVLFRESDKAFVNAFPSHKIQLVRYYDKDEDVNRKFRVMQDPEFTFQHYVLYEIIVLGKFEIVRKPHSIVKEQIASDADDFDYFIVSDAVFMPLRHFKQKLYALMIANSTALQQFVKDERPDLNNPADVVRIVMVYNENILPLSTLISPAM